MNGVEEVIQRRNLVLMRPMGRVTEGQGHRERDRTRSSHRYIQVAVMANSSQPREGRSMMCIQRGAPTFLCRFVY
jgi:hypothetical protein